MERALLGELLAGLVERSCKGKCLTELVEFAGIPDCFAGECSQFRDGSLGDTALSCSADLWEVSAMPITDGTTEHCLVGFQFLSLPFCDSAESR